MNIRCRFRNIRKRDRILYSVSNTHQESVKIYRIEVKEEATRKRVTFMKEKKNERRNEASVLPNDEVAVSRLVTLSMES